MNQQLGDVWTTVRTGKFPPSRKIRKVELARAMDFSRDDLQALMRARPSRWWTMYVFAKENSVIVQFWNRRYREAS